MSESVDAGNKPNYPDIVKSGRRTARAGCFVTLAGIIIPIAMFSIPSIFPCHGECQIGWAGIGLAMFVTPVFVIAGIATFVVGNNEASKAVVAMEAEQAGSVGSTDPAA